MSIRMHLQLEKGRREKEGHTMTYSKQIHNPLGIYPTNSGCNEQINVMTKMVACLVEKNKKRSSFPPSKQKVQHIVIHTLVSWLDIVRIYGEYIWAHFENRRENNFSLCLDRVMLWPPFLSFSCAIIPCIIKIKPSNFVEHYLKEIVCLPDKTSCENINLFTAVLFTSK